MTLGGSECPQLQIHDVTRNYRASKAEQFYNRSHFVSLKVYRVSTTNKPFLFINKLIKFIIIIIKSNLC